METSYWLLRRLKGQWASGEAGLPWAGGIASWPARALLSRRGHRHGPWLQLPCCPRCLCGCCAPRMAAIPAYSPSTWRLCGKCVGERVRGVAECGVDSYPSQASAGCRASPPTEGCGGATWHRGARGDADAWQGTLFCPRRDGCGEVCPSRTLAAARVAAV